MTSLVTIKNSLGSGELSPSLYGRTDLEKWHNGTSTCRNFFVDYKGGVLSRPGTKYIGTSLQVRQPFPPRLIPFQFSVTQGYVLEFGQQYVRFIQNGSYITETPLILSSVNSSGVFTTVSNHSLFPGNWVFDSGNTGFTGLTWIVNTTPTANTFTVSSVLSDSPITSASPSVGGTVARIYTINSPYAAQDLPYLKYTQSADTMTLCLVNTQSGQEYAPYELTRIGTANWTLLQTVFGTQINPPGNLTAQIRYSSIPTTWYSYQVTAVSADTGEESTPCSPIYVRNCDIATFQGSNLLNWSSIEGASYYNIYGAIPSYGDQQAAGSLYGIVGSSIGLSFIDSNIIPDFTQTPPQGTNPFARDSIIGINITPGGNYSTSTISYGIVSLQGNGFKGSPVVSNLGWSERDFIETEVTGFTIQNGGQDYELSDTINIFDSGGGLAHGWYDFFSGSNPGNNTILDFNGANVTFTTTNPPSTPATQCFIGATLLDTLQNLEVLLNSSSNPAWNVADYGIFSANNTTFLVNYKTSGTVGNTYTLNEGNVSSVSRSASTLTGGGTVGTGASGTPILGPRNGTFPGVPAYYQQRKVFASSLNNPDTYWMSQPGLYHNFNTSIPVSDNNSLSGTPWAQQVNGIQFMVPMPGGLVILTGKGAWQLNGGSSAAITPANQVATPQAYNGCHNHIPPLTINYDILYVQAKGSIVRDLSYNFFVNIYTGTDLTLLSNHLFDSYEIREWCWAEEPFKLVWLVRNDGILLSLTYLKEQDLYAWTRHDTNGLFQSITSVTEPSQPESTTEPPALTDAVYVVTVRNIKGNYVYYVERLADRIWNNVEDAFCTDSGLSYPITFPNAYIYPSAVTGNITVVGGAVFNSQMVGDIIRVDGGKILVTSFINSESITGTVIQTLTDVFPNDPLNTPQSAAPNTWSISSPVSVVSGLNHLEGMTVSILADGSVVPQQIVTNGSITLPEPASQIVVGLPYTCQVQTMYIDHTDQNGTQQNRRKTISAVGLRVAQSRGLQMGANQVDSSTQQNYATVPWTNMTEIKERTNNVNAGNGIPLYTGDYYQAITAGWDTKGQVAIQQVYPLPANILAVISYWNTGDDR